MGYIQHAPNVLFIFNFIYLYINKPLSFFFANFFFTFFLKKKKIKKCCKKKDRQSQPQPQPPIWGASGTVYFNISPKVSRLKGICRIGPHNKDVLSIIFGSILGNAHIVKKLNGLGTSITFFQEDSHVEYILSLHKLLSEWGYCNPKTPVVTRRLGTKGKLRKVVRFSTWAYTSLDWIYDIWYQNNKKRLPNSIGEYLTPLALAIWIMDGGIKVGKGLIFSGHSFSYDECFMLVNVLSTNFNIKASVQLAGSKDKYIIYVGKESMSELRNIVSPYIVSGMKYKLI